MTESPKRPKKDPALYHVPPHSIEAEESILSAILIDNTALLDVLEILSPKDFYRLAHEKIFSAVVELFNKDEPVDLVTLSNRLREKGHLEEVGGAVFLARLVDTVPLAVNAAHYAKIIHDITQANSAKAPQKPVTTPPQAIRKMTIN